MARLGRAQPTNVILTPESVLGAASSSGGITYVKSGIVTSDNALFSGPKGYTETIDANTVLALHADGADTSTTFIDSSPYVHTVTAAGGAMVKTDQSKFGGGSLRVTTTNDGLTVPASSDWTLGTGDFTIDLWVRWASYSGASNYTFMRSGAGIPDRSWLFQVSTNFIAFNASADGSTWAESWTFAWTPVIDTWYHVAIVRSGTNLRAFVNGVQQGGTASPSSTNIRAATAGLLIGFDVAGVNPVTGWMDEIRLSKGIARWTSNFTPPTDPYLAGPVFYTKTGVVISSFVASGVDQSTFVRKNVVTSDNSVFSGFDNEERSRKNVVISNGILSGADATAYTRKNVVITGNMILSGPSIRIFNRSGSGISNLILTGTKIRVISRSGLVKEG